ncbi:MAG: peptide ABC transporter substrate-binding protein [Nitrospinota bacterium]|nr:MAG: peptide ABC transporter substrate-binding protein [Nitrospinota bacterium]
MADLLDLLVDIPVVPERVLDDLPERAVGSGPYRLVEASDTRVVMDAFTAYWGGQPAFKRVVWQAEADEEERVQALLAGEADLIAAVSPAGRHLIESTAQRKIITRESHVCVIFMCNALTGVCTDRRVRQALNYALDVPLIIDTIREGAAQPLNGPLTPFHLGYDPHTPPYPYDPERARALLAGAGYGDGLPLLIDVPTVLPDEATELAQCMVEQYARVGIFAEVRVFADRPGYADLVRAKQMDDLCCFDSSPLSTYRVLREKFHSGVRGPWWQGYTNPEVDRLIDQARATVNDTQRQKLYRRAYRLLRDDAPWVFLYRPTLFWGASPQVPDWTIGRDGLIRLVAAPDRMK